MKRTKAKNIKMLKVLATGMLSAAVIGTCFSPVVHANAFSTDGSKYYSDYSSLSEAQSAAAELGKDLGEEGSVLLKNKDNALPLKGNEWVSVVGVSSDSVEGGSTTVADSLKDAGFRVNKEMEKYYKSVGTSYGSENVKDISEAAKSSMNIYNDVAVVIFSRTGGESNDCATVTNEVEDNKYGSQEMSWQHNALYTKEGKEYKHYLQLTDSEEELLELAKANCDKVVVVINSSNVMELGNIEHDNDIDGIIWVGRPGADGLKALGEILNGSVNPSGKTVDIYPADLTADPTWFGYGKGEQFSDYPDTYFRKSTTDGKSEIYKRDNPNMQASIPGVSTGYSVAEYSEGIYMGYRYYETAAAEAVKGTYTGFNYDSQVVYPFGYGQSYTTFEWTNKTPAKNVENWASKKKLSLEVEVENTGKYAGKDVVQVYAHAPYIDGEIEKSEVVLVGYAKTSLLQPGEKETVTITVNVQDIASFDDYDKNENGKTTYELDAGTGYELRFQSDSHNVKATQELSDLTGDVILSEDDYSGKEVTALFSGEDEYNMLGWDPATSKTLVDEGKMTIMSRGDFAGTFPEPATEADLTRSDEWFKFHESFDQYNFETQTLYPEDESDTATNQQPWIVKASDFTAQNGKYSGWKQATSHEADYSDVKIKIQAMTGIDMYDNTTIINEGIFKGKTGAQAWETFMNQLTWDELVKMASNAGWGTPELESVNKPATSDNDGPNNLSSMYSWGDECHIAATWNNDLAYKEGVIMGNMAMQKGTTWYGPAMNTHRSPFGGRCNEYYSQDGYHGGMIGVNVIKGAQSKGVICYVKHCAMNDQEIYRMNLMTISTEQAAREIYFKQFQMAVQEGGTSGLMTTYGSIGEISGATNYNFMTKLLREEWGFKGYAVTDAWMPCKDYWPLDMLVRAGTDAPLENAGARSEKNESYLLSGKYDAAKNAVVVNEYSSSANDKYGIKQTATGETKVSYTQWYSVRMCAQRILYTQSNMNVVLNGYDLSSFKGNNLSASQGAEFNATVAANVDSKIVSYELSGTLPAGLSFNATSGVISGTPTVAGKFSFSVSARIDNWITASANYSIDVASAFSIDSDVSAMKTGVAFSGYIESEVVKAADYDTIDYEVINGSLPAGVNIENDQIVGTPTEAGTFDATIKITATKTTISTGSSGASETKTVKEYEYNVTFTVAEGDSVEDPMEKDIASLKNQISELQTKLEQLETGSSEANEIKTQIKALQDKVAELEKNNSANGCGSVIGLSGAATALALAGVGVALVIFRKKED